MKKDLKTLNKSVAIAIAAAMTATSGVRFYRWRRFRI